MDLTATQGAGTTKVVTNQAAVVAAVPSGYAQSPVFVPKGAVYGASSATPAVVLQARKAASLIVRGAGGSVYFARQLAPGESYRAPTGEGLTADIADPDSFDLYVNGQLQGGLLSGQAPVDKLATAKPAKAA
jgi:cytoskeleton protein RodZ